MEKTIFASPGKFMIVKSASTTPYFYAERKGMDSVAFILVDNDRDDKYGMINERKPPMDHRVGKEVMMETAFGGSNDMIDDDEYLKMSEDEIKSHFKELVQTECREESGYRVPLDKIEFISKELVSTQMNQMCYMFKVNVTGVKQGEADPQNREEAMATNQWKTLKGVQETNDWKAKTILFNLI
jgi:hypothetical protein